MSNPRYTQEQITAAIHGDETALRFLYESTQDRVTQTVRSMIRDEDAVLDIVQDSFVKAFQNLDKLEKPEYFFAWMRRIASNTALNYLKKKKPVLFSELASEDGDEIEFEDEAIGQNPDVLLDQQETNRLIQEIVSGLSEEQQLVIGMYYFEEMPIRTIAQKLGCSENTVKSRLNYGRKNIEKKVRELEKQGTKLYSLAPMPFFLWLLRNDHAQPSQKALEAILSKCAALSSGTTAAAGSAAAKASVKGAANAARKLKTKIIAGILVTAAVGGGAAMAVFGGSSDPTPTQTTAVQSTEASTTAAQVTEPSAVTELQQETQETRVVTTNPPEDPRPAYEAILEEYKAACADPNYLNNREQYPNAAKDGMDYYHSMGAFDLYYAYCDIDSNGVEELLIGTEGDIWDVYAFYGEKPVKLIDEKAMGGGRIHLTVMKTGELYVTGSSGASTGVCYMRRLAEDGFTTQEVFYFDQVMNELGVNYYGEMDREHVTLTEEDFRTEMERYTERTNLQWTILVDAPMTQSEAYQVILDEYTEAIEAMNNESYRAEQYPHVKYVVNHEEGTGRGSSGINYNYLLLDMDGNGTNELIIAAGFEYGQFMDIHAMKVLDIYTYDGTQAVELFQDPALGDTAYLQVGAGGEIYFVDENSENQRQICLEIAPDGYSLTEIYSYRIREEEGQKVYYNDTESLKKSEFIFRWPPYMSALVDAKWTHLGSYVRSDILGMN